MNDLMLRIFHRLPGPARSAVATARGMHLRYWRYGRTSERLVEEALAREQWRPAQWDAWRAERLAFLLERAATRVPYYRAQWAERRRRGDRSSPSVLAHWPVLDKEALRATPAAFLADDCNPARMWSEHTSGTTGKSLSMWIGRRTQTALYALAEARRRRWYGLTRADRVATIGGQLVADVRRRRPPFWVWNAALNQLYMSSYHLSPELIPSYLDALAEHRVTFLEGYTSSLVALAQEALRLGRRDLRMIVAVPNAEPVLAHQRALISRAFDCPVRETYGMAELVAAASECEAGRLHLWPEVGAIEVLEHGEPVPDGTSGELVCTGLLNADMPLIRYRVGDRGALQAPFESGEACECGRRLPQLRFIEGRSDDLLYTADGRRIGRLDPVFKADLPIREAQIVQEALDHVRVRFVPAAGFSDEASRSIADRLRARLGPVRVTLEQVDSIPRGANGKFRAVVCALSPAVVERLRTRPVAGVDSNGAVLS